MIRNPKSAIRNRKSAIRNRYTASPVSLPPALSMAHASLAQGFFCLTISLAVITGNKWFRQQSDTDSELRPSLRRISLYLVAAVYAQLILGAGYRHNALGIGSHILGAAVV